MDGTEVTVSSTSTLESSWWILVIGIILVILLLIFIYLWYTSKSGKGYGYGIGALLFFVILISILIFWFWFRTSTLTVLPTQLVPPGPPTTTIQYGDTVLLRNTDSQFGGYAAICNGAIGLNCGTLVTLLPNVTGAVRQWIIEGGTTGTNLVYGDVVNLKSVSNNNYLAICNNTTTSGCGSQAGTDDQVDNNTTFTVISENGSTGNVISGAGINIQLSSNTAFVLSICGETDTDCGINVTVQGPGQGTILPNWVFEKVSN